jgi:Glycosyl transferase family 2
VKIVQTLVVRDEEEILRANLDYHLATGVDLVLVIDHRSEDATPEILESYRAAGVVRVFREEAQFVPQHEWQTRLARLAFTEHGADWVLLGDADEFWWPLGASLPDVLARVPDTYGSVLGLQRNFVPLRARGTSFAERMVVSLAASAPINDPATPFRPVAKVAVRGSADVVVLSGGHQVVGVCGEQLTAWHPLEILHFPLRSREQCARKYEKTWTGWESNLRGDLARAHLRAGADRVDAMWERIALDEDAVQRGIAEHSLLVDTRLRDALGALGREGSGSARDRGSSSVELLAQVFVEAEVVRRQRWLDDLTLRARRLEDRRWRGRKVLSR